MTARSEVAVARALSTVLGDHGWAVATNARRLRGGLNDVLGPEADEHRGALDAIVLAVDEGVVAELREAGREHAGPVARAMVERLTEWGLARDRAAWAVGAWVAALPEATLPPPVTAEPPSTAPRALRPTTLPPAATAPSVPAPAPAAERTLAPRVEPSTSASRPVRPAGQDVAGVAYVTSPPPTQMPATNVTPRQRRLPGRGALVGAAAAAATLVAGGVAAAVNLSTDEPPRSPRSSAAGTASPEPTTTPPPPPPPPAEAGTVAPAPSARVPVVAQRAAMGSRTGGVRVARLGEVPTVEAGTGTGAAEHSPPEGGRLIAFRLSDWPCEGDSCRPWNRLGLRVAVGKDERPLPKAGKNDTFVVAVPKGVSNVHLVMRSDGLEQSLSLVNGKPGRRNVAVLARPVRVDRVGERFTLTERTSVEFDYGDRVTDTVPRRVSVTRADLAYFTDHGRPSSPGKAFLKVRAHYTIPFESYAGDRFAFEPRELAFVSRDGTRYEARDIDEGPGVDAVFEVPADLKGGTFRMGGSHLVSSNGLPFTRTVTERSIPLEFG